MLISNLDYPCGCASIKGMASLTFYVEKYGRREGKKRYNAYHRRYKRRNREQINAAQRERLRALRERAAVR
jgi:hypothetical protein